MAFGSPPPSRTAGRVRRASSRRCAPTASALASGSHLRREREQLAAADRERTQRQDLLEFQRREIEGSHLDPGEEEALAAEHAILSNHERLFAAVEQTYGTLEESDEAVLVRLAAAARPAARGGRH